MMNQGGIAAAIILPGAVVHFFCGATAGVCGNATGGLKGCVASSYFSRLPSFITSLLPNPKRRVKKLRSKVNQFFKILKELFLIVIKKILCFCGNGLITGFMLEMNAKKALKNLGITGVEVDHTTIDDVVPGAADLFICGSDLIAKAESAGQAIGLDNMVSMDEMTQKLKKVFGK